MGIEQASRLSQHLQFTERDTAKRGRDSEPCLADRAYRLGNGTVKDRPTAERKQTAA